MTAPGRNASGDYSRGPRIFTGALRRLRAVRLPLVAGALAGSAALCVATFSTVIELKIPPTSDLLGTRTTFTGWDRHGVALLLIAGVALMLLFGALRGNRLAMGLLALTGLAGLAIAIGIDLPDLQRTGAVGANYTQGTARAGLGYYAETLGSILLLLCGGLLYAVEASGRTT